MLIVRTPFRISFFGGGTDYYDYFSEYGGCVLSTTIDKYCYLSIRSLPPFFDYKSQVTYSKIERFSDAEEIKHPLVRAALRYMPVERIQLAYDADLPACSGIGSSSAFAVALLQGLHAFKDEYPDKMTLAQQAIYLERDMCAEAGGVQDQLAAAHGGFNRISFDKKGYKVEAVNASAEVLEKLKKNLMLVFTGFTRFSGEIAKEQKKNIGSTISQLDEMKAMVYTAENLLKDGKVDDFGKLLDYTWSLKRTLSDRISNGDIDDFYNNAKKQGALGGKLLGAGGGGFMLLYMPEEKQESFIKNNSNLNLVPFGFENDGTKIIYNDK